MSQATEILHSLKTGRVVTGLFKPGNGALSKETVIESGVLQGTVLGP